MPNEKQPKRTTSSGSTTEKFWSDLHYISGRRRSPRLHARVPVQITPVGSQVLNLFSNDLSYHGLQVRCDRDTAQLMRPEHKGEAARPVHPVVLQLDVDEITIRVAAHVQVAHVSILEDESAESEIAIGMVFVNFEDGAKDALHRFIDQYLAPPES